MPQPPSEIAVLIVNALRFEEWESVWVQHRWQDDSALFKFTCAEREPTPDNWTALQFKPGDECEILLGGQIAMKDGVITLRQVAYDANNHGVLLFGHSRTWFPSTSSVESETGSYDNKNFEQIAREVLKGHQVGIKVIGKLDPTPFKWVQVQTGEKIWDFLERYARPIGAIMGSDHLGNFLLIGEHQPEKVTPDLIEGVNILHCQCTISNEEVYRRYDARNQQPGGDDENGAAAYQQEGSALGRLPQYRVKIVPAEMPMTIDQLVKRARYEAMWSEQDQITATITVQGWLRGGLNQLWRIGQMVRVKSPMAMLDMDLVINVATFTQDTRSGTLTTLELIAPWMQRGVHPLDPREQQTGTPQEPGEGTNTSEQPFRQPGVTGEVGAEAGVTPGANPNAEVIIDEEQMTITPQGSK